MLGSLQPGDPQWLGPYRLLGILGEGGFGRVFLGQSADGQLAAVKMLLTDHVADPEYVVRFRREAVAARKVSGRFTAHVIGADVDGPVPWLATAYIAGPSLADAVKGHGPLPARSLVALAAGLAEALAAIHAAGLVHRDLKPQNVLLAEDGPRVIDFGIARAFGASTLTGAGMVIGTFAFMSPEQAQGRTVGPPSDVFSLGSLLVFAATGRAPFGMEGCPVGELLARVAFQMPDLDQVPDEVQTLAKFCMAKDPAQRPTPGELVAYLRRAGPRTDWLPGPVIRTITRYKAAPADIRATGYRRGDVHFDDPRVRYPISPPTQSGSYPERPRGDLPGTGVGDHRNGAARDDQRRAGDRRSYQETQPRTDADFTNPRSGAWRDAGHVSQSQRVSRGSSAYEAARGSERYARTPSGRTRGMVAIAGILAIVVAVAVVVLIGQPNSGSGEFTPVSVGSGGIGPTRASWRSATVPADFPNIGNIPACFGNYCFISAGSGDMNSQALLYSTSGERKWAAATVPEGEQISVPGGCYQGKCAALATGGGGDQIAYSANWGRSWTVAHTVDSPGSYSDSELSCSLQYCMLAGNRQDGSSFFSESANGGATWLQPVLPPGLHSQGSSNLSCYRGRCVMTAASAAAPKEDNEILASNDRGASWTFSKLPLTVIAVGAPSCIGSRCIVGVALASAGVGSALGALLYSVDSGMTWSVSPLPIKGLQHLLDPVCNTVSCTSVGSAGTDTYKQSKSFLGNTIIYSKNNGKSWSAASLPSSIKNIETPSCVNSVCVTSGNAYYSASAQGVVATRLIYSVDGGATWRVSRIPGGFLFPDSAACWSAGCVMPATYQGSDAALFSDDSGASWSRIQLPAGIVQTNDIPECSAVTCIVPGTNKKNATGIFTQMLYLRKNKQSD